MEAWSRCNVGIDHAFNLKTFVSGFRMQDALVAPLYREKPNCVEVQVQSVGKLAPAGGRGRGRFF